MTATLVTAAYGPAASRALFDAVVAGKGGDPLAPVTVVVPTNYVGVAARRLEATGFGMDKLLMPDDPQNGANRRVEITNLGESP